MKALPLHTDKEKNEMLLRKGTQSLKGALQYMPWSVSNINDASYCPTYKRVAQHDSLAGASQHAANFTTA